VLIAVKRIIHGINLATWQKEPLLRAHEAAATVKWLADSLTALPSKTADFNNISYLSSGVEIPVIAC
jgi:hypothetical protein